MFRAVSAEDTPLAREVRELLQRGEYVPDQLTNQLVLARLAQPDAQRGFILDGYPRTEPQAVALDRALAAEGRAVDLALLMVAPAGVLIERVTTRHDARTDDTPEAIERRLREYQTETQPVADYYAGQGKLVEIDAARPLPEVNAQVDAAVDRVPSRRRS